jgi:RNA polymerase sigma factor (sigma-70 family)
LQRSLRGLLSLVAGVTGCENEYAGQITERARQYFEALGVCCLRIRVSTMVVENIAVYLDASSPGVNNINYIPHRLAVTEEAAEQAIVIAERIATTSDWRKEVDDCDEQALFAALHTCAYRAMRQPLCRSNRREMPGIWGRRWNSIRDHIVQRNLGLAYSTLSRFRTRHADWDDLRGEALLALLLAVEGFDPWRGHRFSSYACIAISRALINEANRARRHRRRFLLGYDVFQECPVQVDGGSELHAERLQRVLERNSAGLTNREWVVLARRFAMDGGDEQTLAQVGHTLGLSKERVRQIQNRALGKIRKALQADPALQ